jgi:hypothetical protein
MGSVDVHMAVEDLLQMDLGQASRLKELKVGEEMDRLLDQLQEATDCGDHRSSQANDVRSSNSDTMIYCVSSHRSSSRSSSRRPTRSSSRPQQQEAAAAAEVEGRINELEPLLNAALARRLAIHGKWTQARGLLVQVSGEQEHQENQG